MTATLLAALLVLPVRAASPAAEAVDAAFARIAVLLASEKGRHARAVDELDRKAYAEGDALRRHGWRAVEPLGRVAADLRRPMKERLLAAAFLARTGDPLAAGPLEAVLLDPRQDPLVRASAAESLAALPLSPSHARRAFTRALALPDLPSEALAPALAKAALTGLDDAEVGRLVLRRLGARPEGSARDAARLAAAALGRTPGAGAVDALLDLLRRHPADSPARGDLIAALAAKRADLLAFRRPQARAAIEDALRAETGEPARMAALIGIAAGFGPELAPALARLSHHPDGEVLVLAAEGLVRLEDRDAARRALPDLEAAVAGALTDPRFSPKDGRPDPAVLLARLEKAVAALKPVASAPPR
ncbi:MAG: hypothetical protein SF051_08285 [Elusimicrobiota bacterium]|nr:hypothetical protein [Elusimicrobiota bacterium]